MSRRRTVIVLTALVASGLCEGRQDQESFPLYTGRQTCLTCHVAAHPSGVCSLEPIPEHLLAFESLAQPEAAHIAAINGVAEPPQDSRVCLGCHATAADEGRRWTRETFRVQDGVQCEACHGAGSLHVDGYRQPQARDLPDANRRLSPVDRTICARCHADRPSHRLVLDAGYRRPAIDAHYRTPENLAVSPDGRRLYVVCTNSDELLVVDPETRAVRAEIAVGRRPHDVAVSPDGVTIYVTNRASDTLTVIDAATETAIAEIATGDEPHGVLTDAAGRLVFVLNTTEDSISVIDAAARAEVTRLAGGGGPWSAALRPDGASVYVTNVWPLPASFREPPRSEVTVLDAAGRSTVIARPAVPEANMLQGIDVVPGSGVALFTMMRTKNLVPTSRLAQGWTITNGLGVAWPDGRVDQVLLDEPAASFPDATDVAVTPDGRHALVTSGGSDRVAVVDVAMLLELISVASDRDRREVLPDHLGMSRRFVLRRLAVGRNPRGVVVSPDGRLAYVANALDDSLSVIDLQSFAVTGTIDLGGPNEISQTRWGERLFHSADITFGRQFSCRSCHPDGHINGLTHDIEADGIGMHPVDNRTLRGILDTAPFKWEGTNPTLSRQCGPRLAVFFTRLSPYTPAELAALTRYISTIERPPNRYRRPEGLTLAQRRGKAVFERITDNYGQPIPSERRCHTCHYGPYSTAGTRSRVGTTMWFDAPVETDVVDLADLVEGIEQYGDLGVYYFLDTGTPTRAFDVPHLNNIYDSRPYLHNGAAATLHEVWTRFDVLTLHGATADLTRQQLNDLIEYLNAL